MRGAEIDEKMRAAFGITGSLKIESCDPSPVKMSVRRMRRFNASRKVQPNTFAEMQEPAGTTAEIAPADSIFANVDQPR
ncbi:hypothetical protein S23_31100 [Bradyrhizobium cosmicum]|uniref:Uncharacterized protein n=1 Tax=Bradyrhizobium cosmicum TaxID=1404864 RepID=A0AAI8QCE5_9BRAD|nr:hypothetical protein S23_31100 [Bradyrhizobium cosmicum]